MIMRHHISTHSRLLGYVWRAARLGYMASAGVFIALYYFFVVPSVYEITDLHIILQIAALLMLLLGWRAIGNPVWSLGWPLIVTLTLWATIFGFVTISLIGNIQQIITWSTAFPDTRYDKFVGQFGKNAPVILFLSFYITATVMLILGVISSLILRWKQIPSAGESLIGMHRYIHDALKDSSAAPNLWRYFLMTRRRGWFFGFAAVIVILIPFTLAGREVDIPWAPGLEALLPDIMARITVAISDRAPAVIIAGVIAFVLWQLARVSSSPPANLVLTEDERPPVLLLRAFSDDNIAVQSTALWRRLLMLPVIARLRLEEVVDSSHENIGPFVAVHDPGAAVFSKTESTKRHDFLERLRRFFSQRGAFRVAFDDGEWKQGVTDLIIRSHVVIMVAGTNKGVTWELNEVQRVGALNRLVLMLPPKSQRDQNALWKHLSATIHDPNLSTLMQEIKPANVLALYFPRTGGLKLVIGNSRKRRERDYNLAIRICLYQILK